jgi:hypothetical protein
MRFNEIDTLPPEAVHRLDPARVQEYARATGWVHQERLGRGRTAVYQRPESRLEQFSVPLSRELADFDLVMATAVTVIAQHEKRPATELLTELLFPPADILKFAESGPAATSGDVPFVHGLDLLGGTRKILLAAACTTIRPLPFHPRMSLTEAEQFLQQCRLGQTERGSFVLTVACPLNAVPLEPDLFDGSPFTRRVTEYLMRSLHRLASALDLGDADAVLREAQNEPVLSANLCEGLLDMAPEGEDSFLRVTTEFSRTLPQAVSGSIPKTVRLRREVFPSIEYLAGRLRPTPALQRQVLVGLVETLNGRPNAENRPEGQVILRIITPESEILRARADLNANDYARADQAHMGTIPVSLEGVLRQVGRSFRIDHVSNFVLLPLTQPAAGATS